MLSQLDLCSGVGAGFPLAGVALGLELVGLCEVDPFCRNILRRRFPWVPTFEDVKTYPWKRYAARLGNKPDVITASPPCQPFSVRGKRGGAGDERDCFPAILEAIAALEPKYVAIENVRGLLSCSYRPGDPNKYFAFILAEFSHLGYDVEWIVASSGAFGAPFLRERLLMVAISHRVKLRDWETVQIWGDDIRVRIEEGGDFRSDRSCKSGMARKLLRTTPWLDESTGKSVSIGASKGNSITQERRSALGNSLDPRVAKIAIERILYHQSSLKDHRWETNKVSRA